MKKLNTETRVYRIKFGIGMILSEDCTHNMVKVIPE